jgi:iron(II)-dependent oxidoreductase
MKVRRGLLQRLAAAREHTDKLFALIHSESLYQRPIPERHRIIFYVGHLEAFDWNLLLSSIPNQKPFNPEFDRLFAFGIDPVESGLPSDQASDWPARHHIERYRDQIRSVLDNALRDWRLENEAREVSHYTLLNVAIEHRLMHAETLAYMMHQLPYDLKVEESQFQAPSATKARTSATVEIPAGYATLGMARGDSGPFGWDNEFEVDIRAVPAFAIDRYKVTNGEFLNFVKAGGYQDRSLWTGSSWSWKERQGISHPLFWVKAIGSGSTWRYRSMFEEIPLPLDWPVYVSFAEANAYAAWAGKRLPCEAEWHRAAYGTSEGVEREFPWGSEQPCPEQGYFDFRRWDPSPVDALPAATSAFGVEGMIGNGWEWTSSHFEPFPGFQPFPFYEGYSANFFDRMHYVLKGGSPRSAQSMLRRSFRNWFQPHYPYVYAGFRCTEI